MAKRRREKVSEDTVTAEDFYTAFIDTSLGTHLAMIISSSDTVSHLKKKIVLEHSQLFPRIGEIKVLSLQVKRQGHFYHLPDSMLVISAYEGSKRHKFLFVNASSLEEHDREQHSSEPNPNPNPIGHVALLHVENCPQLNEDNLLSDDPSKHVSFFVHGSASAKIPNAVQPSPRNFQGEILKASVMEVSHIDDDCQRDLYSDSTRKLALRVSKDNKDSSHDNAKHIQLENLDELSPESGFAVKKSKTELNEIGVSDSVIMKRSSSDHEIVNIETAVVYTGKSIPMQENICNLGSKEHVGDNSDSSNWKKFTKPAKCTTDRQENIFSSNVTSEQLKDDQLFTSMGSKKGKKKQERTSSVPSDQADIPGSTPIQNIEEEQKKGNLKIGFKVLDNLSGSATAPRESIQPETFSRPSVLTQKGTRSDQVVEGSKRACSLEEFDFHEPGAGNEEGKMSAFDQTAEHGVNGKTSSMKLQAANMEDFASPVIIGLDDVNKVTSQAHDENVLLGNLDYVALQADRKGHEEIKLNHDHEVMPSERCKPSDEGDADGTNKASFPMPKLIATSGPMEIATSDGKRNKKNNKKRSKKKASAMQTDSVAEQTNIAGANSSDGPNLNAEDHSSEKTDKNESMLPPAETDQTNKVEEERGLSANLDPQGKTSECFKPADCGQQLNQSGRLKVNDSNLDKKAKKKKKKNQISAAEILSSSEIKDQNIVAEELAASDDKTKGMDSPSCATKTSRLAKRRTVIQSTASDLEVEKNAGADSNSSNPEHAPKDANPFEVLLKGRPETEIDNRNYIETAKGEDKGINLRHYFVPGQHQDKVASSVKVKDKSQSRKPKRKKEKHNVVAENMPESSEHHGKQNKSDGRNVDDNRVEESASSDEQNKILLSGNKKTSKASEDGVKAPSYHEVDGDKILGKAVKPAVADGTGANRTAPALLENNNGSLTAPSPSSSSKGSKRVVSNTSRRKQQSRSNQNTISNRKNSSKSAGDVLNSSGQEKSLLTTPRTIFREDSSGSSSDEHEIVNSDASTRTPSDSSSSSGFSVGESDGPVNETRKGGGAGNISSAKFLAPRQMSMDLLLRSSSRFKKAKLAASQSEAADTESQPVDFVPDSRPNQ